MARQKVKEARLSTFNLSLDVIERLNSYCEKTGLPKTTAVERFITKGIDDYEGKI